MWWLPRMFRQDPLKRAEQEVEIVKGLLRMKGAGKFLEVHVHANRIAVESPLKPGQKIPLPWERARKLIKEFELEQKLEAKGWPRNARELL